MPSPISVNVKMKPYLIQYLVNKYGPQPIVFPKQDRFSSFLPFMARKPLPGENQFINFGNQNLCIVLAYQVDKNVLYHNFIPASAQAMFESMIHKSFRVDFHEFMNEAYLCRAGIEEAVIAFIDINNLHPDCMDLLIKERQRYMKQQRNAKWRRKVRQLTAHNVLCEDDV